MELPLMVFRLVGTETPPTVKLDPEEPSEMLGPLWSRLIDILKLQLNLACHLESLPKNNT